MKNKISIILAAIAMVAFTAAVAMASSKAPDIKYADVSAKDAEEINEAVQESSSLKEVSSDVKIYQLIKDYEVHGQGRIFKQKQARHELFYITKMAAVSQKPSNKNWVDYRTKAFQTAFIEAQSAYLNSLQADIQSELFSGLIKDSKRPEFSESELRSTTKVGSVIDKLVAYGDALVSGKLDEMGIDSKKFNALPPSKQKVMLEKYVGAAVKVRSVGKLSGLLIVKTFEAYDSNGQYIVAVAVIASPKIIGFAEELLKSQEKIAPNPKRVGGQPIYDQVVTSDKALVKEYGIRRIYDENGYPVLISFGQAGNPYTGQDFQMKMLEREAAFEFAKNEAFANFAYLLNSYGKTESKTAQKEFTKVVAKTVATDDGIEDSEAKTVGLVKKLNRSSQVKGSVRLTGIYELYRYTVPHPITGNEVNGVVYAWSPVSAKMMKSLRAKPKPKKVKTAPREDKSVGSSGSQTGRDFMDANDF